MYKIDFVMLWVDGADEAWLEEKKKYDPMKNDYSSAAYRYRSFDNLQYWFRGVEKFAPWVNNVYFITWGHLPSWLNVNHPKLKIVKHTDYIPQEYLPTFNSNVIELNLNRIEELSDTFVLFNDDTFLLDNVVPEDFFVNGLPKDQILEYPIKACGKRFRIAHTVVNNMNIINEHFNKRKTIKTNPAKYFSLKYGKHLIHNIMHLPYCFFAGFFNPHLPQPHLKKTFATLWQVEGDVMHDTSLNKFRGLNDVSHWLMRYWNLCSGMFVPQKNLLGTCFTVSNDNRKIYNFITRQKGKVVCINDVMSDKANSNITDFDQMKNEINSVLDSVLPDKSSFEL